MVRCPSCGRENDPSYSFCLVCGHPLTGERRVVPGPEVPAPTVVGSRPTGGQAQPARGDRICAHCGRPVPPGFEFCTHCGARYVEHPKPGPEARQPLGVGPKVFFHQIRTDGGEGVALPIGRTGTRIGRTVGFVAFEADPFMSPLHATAWLGPDDLVYIRDEGSLNGTFVRIEGDQPLYDGDLVRIGQQLLKFETLGFAATQPEADGTLPMGSPTDGVWGRLSLCLGREEFGDAYLLDKPRVVIGRERGDILFPGDGFVSGRHAEVATDGRRAVLRDLGSSNGTFVRIKGEHPLRPGQLLLIGQQLFRVEVMPG